MSGRELSSWVEQAGARRPGMRALGVTSDASALIELRCATPAPGSASCWPHRRGKAPLAASCSSHHRPTTCAAQLGCHRSLGDARHRRFARAVAAAGDDVTRPLCQRHVSPDRDLAALVAELSRTPGKRRRYRRADTYRLPASQPCAAPLPRGADGTPPMRRRGLRPSTGAVIRSRLRDLLIFLCAYRSARKSRY
jgi:hypothetical protein